MAAVALTFDDRRLRRQLTIRDPEAVVRAKLALQLVERRDRRGRTRARLTAPCAPLAAGKANDARAEETATADA